MGTEACASGAAVGVADLLRLQTAVLWHRDFAQAAAALATALCDRLRCDRVALGWIRADCSAVVALSHAADSTRGKRRRSESPPRWTKRSGRRAPSSCRSA